MKLIQNLIILCFGLITAQVYAEKMLLPPNGQSPECNQSYEQASQPKGAENVLAATTAICLHRGGFRVLHKVLSPNNPKEPTGLILTCIGDNPNAIIFNCQFPFSYEDL